MCVTGNSDIIFSVGGEGIGFFYSLGYGSANLAEKHHSILFLFFEPTKKKKKKKKKKIINFFKIFFVLKYDKNYS